MSPGGDHGTPGGGSTATRGPTATARSNGRQLSIGLLCIALCGLALVFLSGAGGATVPGGTFNESNDTEAPTVGNLTKVDLVTLELEILDDRDVDEGSINATDFVLSDGTLSQVSVRESGTNSTGSNATVTLKLAQRIDTDQLSVTVADGASIFDVAGNQLDDSGSVLRTVNGMDGISPSVRTLEVDNGSGDRIDVTVGSSEDLASLSVKAWGPDVTVLTLDDFRKPSGIPEYEATVRPDADGEYRVTVLNLTDGNNNTRDTSVHQTVTVDVTAPNAIAGIDFAASEGRIFTFDAGRSADSSPISNVSWAFGDGSVASGERVTHRFEPGNYTVTLRVTDSHGNVGTDELVLNVSDGNKTVDPAQLLDASDGVTISRAGSAGAGSAIVDVSDAEAGQSITIGGERSANGTDGRPLAGTDAVSLEALEVTLSTNASYGLAVQADGPTAVADVADGSQGVPVGAFTVVHDVADADVANVTFTFRVDPDRLAEANLDPDQVTLYRHHDGEWTALPTERLNGTNDTHRFEATAPGLSRFAVAATPENTTEQTETQTATQTETETGSPSSPRVTDATLNVSSVEPGSAVLVSATVANGGEEVASYTAGLRLEGEVLDTRMLRVPPGENRTVEFLYETDETGEYAVAVNDSRAGTLSVGGGGGLLSGVFGIFGFLPLGLIQTLVTYVGGVLVALFLVLKAVALYLGY